MIDSRKRDYLEVVNVITLKEFYKDIRDDKFKINKGGNTIKMDLFLSFLTVDTTRSESYLGKSNGWTRLENKEHKLFISGGYFKGTEYLDSLKYGNNLDNVYNDFVNPFYLFDVMNEKGKNFFLSYYKEDIKEVLNKKDSKIMELNDKIKQLKEDRNLFDNHFNELGF